jgi:PAS domain S-box-containing protein
MRPPALPDGASLPLSAVIATEELFRRPPRTPDYKAESRVLAALAQELGSSPQSILQKLVEASLGLCRAHSAGISLLDEHDGRKIFRWPAIAGEWAPHVGGTTPRDFSPCGVVLDRNRAQLFVRFDRHYPYLSGVTRPACEALSIPFFVGGEAVGTVWVLSHDERRQFDAEDFRLLNSIGKFASAAFGLLTAWENRKQVEASLRQSEQRARLALDVARLGTWSWDPQRDVIDADLRCREIWGCVEGATITFANLRSLIHPDDRPRIEAAIAAALRPDGTGRYGEELRLVHPRGTVRWVAASGQTSFEPAGETKPAVVMLGTILDITERKLAEQALKESDQHKDEFLVTLAHELRNPLAPIRNSLQILRMAKNDSEAIEEARSIMERQVGRMVRITDDLLDVSRISRGHVLLHVERIELQTAIRNAVETSQPAIQDGGHQLTVDMPSEPVLVNADEARLAQVFANLLNNAAKYTERNGHIRLKVERRGAKNVVTVKDSGVGIPAQMLTRVFEMFTQVDRSLERSQGGLGIGLHVVRRLVELHGGAVEAKSDGEGMGSEFIVTLPVSLSLVQGSERQRLDVPEMPRRSALREVQCGQVNRLIEPSPG